MTETAEKYSESPWDNGHVEEQLKEVAVKLPKPIDPSKIEPSRFKPEGKRLKWPH